jgi:Xaa-Pro aminopeptidase
MYSDRRKQLLQSIDSGIAILPSAALAIRNGDAHYPYRPESSFWYLAGFREPDAVLVLDATHGLSILFCHEKDPEREIWDGFRYGPQAAREEFGFDQAYALSELDSRMPGLLSHQSQVQWPIGRDQQFDARVCGWVSAVRAQARSGEETPSRFADAMDLVDEMRLIKDDYEIGCLRRAGRISAEAHVRAIQSTRPGMKEYQIEAELLHTFLKNGARWPAYESIVAGGGNACTLHYVANNSRLNDGELLLVDAGCELYGYAGDITRTFPINGKFSPAQRDVYQIVLAAQQAAIDLLQPGVAINVPADAALKVLTQGMLDLHLLSGTLDGAIESGAYRQFYMHGIGHMVGLDVHDVGKRKSGEHWREYRVGMCTTVEPGLYIRPAANVPPALENIGIRIEDNVLITDSGHEVYTHAVPKQISDIEALMSGF